MPSNFPSEILYGLLVILGVYEVYWGYRTGVKVHDPRETAANVFIILVSLFITEIVTVAVGIYIIKTAYTYRIFDFEYVWWHVIVALIGVDFSWYWMHRIVHTVKPFWIFHVPHHSAQTLNVFTFERLHWFGPAIHSTYFAPLALLGVHPMLILFCFRGTFLYQGLCHTRSIGKIPWLEGILLTPSSHRVHHGRNDIYVNKNYGAFTLIWDRLFGTYQPETEPVRFGINREFVGYNPFNIVFHGFRDYFSGRMNYK